MFKITLIILIINFIYITPLKESFQSALKLSKTILFILLLFESVLKQEGRTEDVKTQKDEAKHNYDVSATFKIDRIFVFGSNSFSMEC